MLLSLDCLMKSVGVSSAGHYTSRELVDDQDLIILDNIVLVLKHVIVCFKSIINMMENFNVFRIRKVFDVKEFFRLFDALLGKCNRFCFFIDNKISFLLYLLLDKGVKGIFLVKYASLFKPFCESVGNLIKLRRLRSASGNNKGRSCLVDKDGIHLVDDGVMKSSLDDVLDTNDHIVPQIIESKLIVRSVCYIAGIGRLSFRACKSVKYYADAESHKPEYLAHPIGVTACQVIVYRNDMDSLSLKSVEVSGHNGHEGLSLTGFHLGNTTLVKDDSSDELHSEGLHLSYPPSRFPYGRECLGQKIVKGLSGGKSAFKLFSLCPKLLIRQRLHSAVITFNFIYNRIYLL